jgi:hypothetical protein
MKLKALLLLCIVACAGCQSKRTFTDEQIAAMRKEGFSPNAEGWGLGMSDKILFGINESELTPESKTMRLPALNICALMVIPIITAPPVITNSCR